MQSLGQANGPLLAVAFGFQHSLLQARHQLAEPLIQIAVAEDLSHFVQAALDRGIGTLHRQAATHQAAPQQIDALLPARLELLLPLGELKILFLPAFDFFAHFVSCTCTGRESA